jgi:beta-glucosidase
MGVASVSGLQGEGKELGPGKVFATLKHMTGHGQPLAGNNVAPALLGERELREAFFPPFRAVVERTGIGAVMPSYNEIDGVPSHANKWLIGDVLRGEWGFDGAIVSDYAGVEELATFHKLAPDLGPRRCSRCARGSTATCPTATPTARSPRKCRPGAFRWRWSTAPARTCCGSSSAPGCSRRRRRCRSLGAADRQLRGPRARARRRAQGDHAARQRRHAAADGWGARPRRGDRAQCGDHPARRLFVDPRTTVSLLDGVKARLAGKAEVLHAQGVFITRDENRSTDDVQLADRARNLQLIAEAVEVAETADVVILAIGDTEQTSREGYARTHLGDRADIDIVGEQNELFDAIKASASRWWWSRSTAGRRAGRRRGDANAMLECWYLGQEGGTAMAEALFGDINPGGKLPVTVVREEGQIPFFYNHKPSARRGYLFADVSPLFPFGFGLSYTTFEMSEPRLSAPKIGRAGTVTVEGGRANTGQRAGDEVVQVYVHDQVASVTRPIKELKAFERVTLQPGETKDRRFTLGPEASACGTST